MKHTVTGFIHHYKSSWEAGRFGFANCDMTNVDGYTTVMPYSFEVDIPDDFDFRPAQIAALKEKQRVAGAAFAALATEINRQISELSAIEYAGVV